MGYSRKQAENTINTGLLDLSKMEEFLEKGLAKLSPEDRAHVQSVIDSSPFKKEAEEARQALTNSKFDI